MLTKSVKELISKLPLVTVMLLLENTLGNYTFTPTEIKLLSSTLMSISKIPMDVKMVRTVRLLLI